MGMANTNLESRLTIYAPLVLIMGAAFLVQVLASSGLYPVVFADEYVYSKLARLVPLSESSVPNYLYLAVFRTTNMCGSGFLECARLLNSLLYVAAAIPIYAVSRRVASRPASCVAVFLAEFGAASSYTAYFMPEAFYWLSFWVFSWYLLSIDSTSYGKHALAGVLLGFAALVKPHAFSLLLPLSLYIGFSQRRLQHSSLYESIKCFLFLAFTALATRSLLGYFLAGEAGLSLLGSTYGAVAENSTGRDLAEYFEWADLALKNAGGHIMSLCVMYGLPILLVFSSLRASAPGELADRYLERVSIYFLCLSLALVPLTAIFTASVSGSGPYESIFRLHIRYYFFLCPLLYVVCAANFSSKCSGLGSYADKIVAFIVLTIGSYALVTNLGGFQPTFVDSPGIRGFTYNRTAFLIFGTLTLGCLTFYIFSKKSAVRLLFIFVLPITTIGSSLYVGNELRTRLVADSYDRAGLFAKNNLTNQEASNLLFVGASTAGLMRSLFYIDQSNGRMVVSESTWDVDSLVDKPSAIITIDQQPGVMNGYNSVAMFGFVIYTPVGQ